MSLKILEAKYGFGMSAIDVSNILISLINNNELYISKRMNLNILFTDPYPNHCKTLNIKYSYDDNEYMIVYNEKKSKLVESVFIFNRNFMYNSIDGLSKNDSLFINFIVRKYSRCNFLFFGNIDMFKNIKKINKLGTTILIGDSKENIEFNNLDLFSIDYNSQRKDWDELLHNKEKLLLNLPKNILDIKWDIIFLAGPKGYSEKCTGRMKSIFTASKLINKNTNIVILDIHRKIEKLYSEVYIESQFEFKKYIGSILSWHY